MGARDAQLVLQIVDEEIYSSSHDYYRIFGFNGPPADSEQAEHDFRKDFDTARRKTLKHLHPDTRKKPEGVSKEELRRRYDFVNKAADTLRNPVLRSAYDYQWLRGQREAGEGFHKSAHENDDGLVPDEMEVDEEAPKELKWLKEDRQLVVKAKKLLETYLEIPHVKDKTKPQEEYKPLKDLNTTILERFGDGQEIQYTALKSFHENIKSEKEPGPRKLREKEAARYMERSGYTEDWFQLVGANRHGETKSDAFLGREQYMHPAFRHLPRTRYGYPIIGGRWSENKDALGNPYLRGVIFFVYCNCAIKKVNSTQVGVEQAISFIENYEHLKLPADAEQAYLASPPSSMLDMWAKPPRPGMGNSHTYVLVMFEDRQMRMMTRTVARKIFGDADEVDEKIWELGVMKGNSKPFNKVPARLLENASALPGLIKDSSYPPPPPPLPVPDVDNLSDNFRRQLSMATSPHSQSYAPRFEQPKQQLQQQQHQVQSQGGSTSPDQLINTWFRDNLLDEIAKRMFALQRGGR